MSILKTMVVCLVILSCLSFQPLYAQSPVRGINEYSPQELVQYYAGIYQVSAIKMAGTIDCESGWSPLSTGDHGLANGIAQFHKATFVSWAKEFGQPLDYTSTHDQIELMAWAFSKHYTSSWSCYTKLYTNSKHTI